jgi:hypothetical protein
MFPKKTPAPISEPRKARRRPHYGADAAFIVAAVSAGFALRLTPQYLTDDRTKSRELMRNGDPDDLDTATEQQPSPATGTGYPWASDAA